MLRRAALSIALLAGFLVVAPIEAQTGSPPKASELPRLLELSDKIAAASPAEIALIVQSLSSADVSKMLWVMKAQNAIRTGTVPSAGYSDPSPPSRAYVPPSTLTPRTRTSTYQYTPPVTSNSRAKARPKVYDDGNTAIITANPYLGSPMSKYDERVSKYSVDGALNPYTTGGGKIYGEDGKYLGKLNSNKYDPESIANPYGEYGSKYSPTSIKNPYSEYGSKYSPKSATNPYAYTPPKVIYGDSAKRW